MGLPTCTVVVATFNRVAGLKRLLETLADQDVGPENFEVVVVDDGSTDETWQFLNSVRTPFALHSLTQTNQGPAAARNEGIRAASGDVIVTLDDDVEPHRDLLRRHLEAHLNGQPVAAIGRFALPQDAQLAPWVAWEFTGLEQQYAAMKRGDWEASPRQFYTANASVPRAAYLEAGLFDPVFRRGEDVELAYRLRDLGLHFKFLPDAIIDHRPNRTFADWQRIARQYGHYDILMWRTKGREHILSLIGHEFRNDRPAALQFAAQVLIGRRRALHLAVRFLGASARVGAFVSLDRFMRPVFSAIFNLLYWQGVADALGGRDVFLASVIAGSAANAAVKTQHAG